MEIYSNTVLRKNRTGRIAFYFSPGQAPKEIALAKGPGAIAPDDRPEPPDSSFFL